MTKLSSLEVHNLPLLHLNEYTNIHEYVRYFYFSKITYFDIEQSKVKWWLNIYYISFESKMKVHVNMFKHIQQWWKNHRDWTPF